MKSTEERKEYRIIHWDRVRAIEKKSYQKHKEERKAASREYSNNHKEQRSIQRKEFRSINRDRISTQRKEHYYNNLDKMRAYSRKQYLKHGDKYKKTYLLKTKPYIQLTALPLKRSLCHHALVKRSKFNNFFCTNCFDVTYRIMLVTILKHRVTNEKIIGSLKIIDVENQKGEALCYPVQ